jgi:primosomal protein N''
VSWGDFQPPRDCVQWRLITSDMVRIVSSKARTRLLTVIFGSNSSLANLAGFRSNGSTESTKRVEATAHMICIYDTKRISEEIFEKIVVSMEIKQNSSSPSEFQSHATLIRYTLIRHAPVSDLVGEEGSRNNRASRQRQS